MKQRQSQEAWKLAMELFQLADMTISGEVLRNAQGKAAFRCALLELYLHYIAAVVSCAIAGMALR